MSLRQAVESLESATTDVTAEMATCRRGLLANADVGHYAGRAAELATDLAGAGAPAELVEYARDGGFDDDQRKRVESVGPRDGVNPGETPAPPAEPTPGA